MVTGNLREDETFSSVIVGKNLCAGLGKCRISIERGVSDREGGKEDRLLHNNRNGVSITLQRAT